MPGYNGVAHLGPKLDDVVREYALWIDQRYSHRFLGLGPTAWDNALVELDAKASDLEYPTTIEVALPVGSSRLDVRKALSVKASHLLWFEDYKLLAETTEAGEKVYEVAYDNDTDPWEEDEWQQPRRVCESQMLEEKRRERNRVARRRKEHALYKPIAQQPWMWREGLRREHSTNLSSFDSIMKSVYTDDAINATAKYDNPMYAMLKKTSAQPNTVYVVTAIDTATGTITVGQDPGFAPPAQITAFGGMKVIANASVPKDKAYLIPSNIADYLNVDSDE